MDNNAKAKVLAKTLDQATTKFLENKKSPSRKVGEIDNRGSHFYLATYWAEALAAQTDDEELKNKFSGLASALVSDEDKIMNELNGAQGAPVELGGYYYPNDSKASDAMRPSETLNEALATL